MTGVQTCALPISQNDTGDQYGESLPNSTLTPSLLSLSLSLCVSFCLSLCPDETEGSSANAGSTLPRPTSNKESYGSSLSLPTKLRQVSVSLQKLSLCLLEGRSVRISKHIRPRVCPRMRPKTGVSLTPPEEDTAPDWQPHHKSPPWPARSLPPAGLLAAVSVPLSLLELPFPHV